MTEKIGKTRFFACFLAFILATLAFGAIDTKSIEVVRNKDVLDNSDFQVIDKFVSEAVHDMVDTKDFSDVASITKIIIEKSSSNKEGAQAQYQKQYYGSAMTYISEALKSADKVTDETRPVMIVNLLILIDGLKNVQLAELAVDRLGDDHMAVRYWAVRCLTNPQLKFTSQVTGTIIRRLQSFVEKSSPQIVELMARFAAAVPSQQGNDLMGKIADARIKQYFNWSVKNELIDASILKIMAAKISAESTPDPNLTQRFAQLFSCAIQRYLKGTDVLNDVQKQQLISVIVETERECIIRRFGLKTRLKEAFETKNLESLLAEHNSLLGDAANAGQLGTKFNFKYTGADGKETTGPQILPDFQKK